jgi:hypothetical protein
MADRGDRVRRRAGIARAAWPVAGRAARFEARPALAQPALAQPNLAHADGQQLRVRIRQAVNDVKMMPAAFRRPRARPGF